VTGNKAPRIAALVPMRHSSERVKGKNYRELAGIPLYHHIVRTLLAVPQISQVVIDTDSDLIFEDAAQAFPEVVLLRRPEHLRSGDTPMNDVLLNTVDQIDAEVFLQTHSTNPFLSAATVASAIQRYLDGENDCDSVFGVTRLQARLWTADGKPVNHDPAVLLRTQDLEPIYLENSTMYIFTPDILRERGNRIGANPLLVEVPAQEAVDIDEEWEFELAQAIAAARG
jgi:CMP-N-acetylneuraminic acid synthetase